MVCCGNDIKLYKKLLPSIEDIKPYLLEALSISEKGRISFCGFPLCVAPSYEWASVEIQEMRAGHSNLYLSSHKFKDYRVQNDVIRQEFCKYEECGKCSLYNICLGFRVDYLRVYPTMNLKLSKRNPQKVLKAIKVSKFKVQ